MRRPVLAAAALTLAACQAEERDPAPSAPRPVAWAAAEAVAAREVRRLPGEVRPVDRATLSFEVSGRLVELPLEIGDHFEEGEVIARLDETTLRMSLAERRSELEEAEATLREASAEFRRQEELFSEGWVSEAAYDTALSARETARSRVERLTSSVSIAEETLADATLRAPYAGIVARRLAEPSQRVAAGEAVYEIQGNGGGVEIAVAVPETLVERLDREAVHEVRVPARPGLTLEARVREIGSDAAEANAFTVTLGVEDAPRDIRTGLTAEVALALRAEGDGTGLAVPVEALVMGEGDTAHVFVIDREGATAHRRAVTAGRLDGARAVVSTGLEPGEAVVTRGATFVRDGQDVRLLGEGPARFND